MRRPALLAASFSAVLLFALGGCDLVPNDDGGTCSDKKPCDDGQECVSGKCEAIPGPDVSEPEDAGSPDIWRGPDDAGAKPDTGPAADAGPADVGAPKECTETADCADAFPDAPPCHVATCSQDTGKCELDKAPDGTVCMAGNECSPASTCQDGTCKAGAATVNCNDDNPCTKDTCKPGIGCAHEPKGGYCDDGDPCTLDDECKDGGCGGTAKVCDDGNACTNDGCVDGGCVSSPNNAPCDDGDLCTVNDACAGGSCKSGQPMVCGDSNPCTDDGCDASTGKCYHDANYSLCDDGDACTSNDACQDGACAGIPAICDDGDPCTYDTCDKAKGGCVFNICLDGDACTTDSCIIDVGPNGLTGNCTFKPMPCNDGDPCTFDACNEAFQDDYGPGCTFTPVLYPCKCTSHEECEDGDSCTVDICQYGVCQHHKKKCGDGEPSTYDYCDPGIGAGVIIPGGDPLGDKIDNCVHVIPNLGGKPGGGGGGTPGSALDYCLKDADCDSGTACVTDKCVDNWCQHTPVDCADDSPWTQDWCHKYLGCMNSTVKPCNGDADCFDGNACTDDLCDTVTGKCFYQEINCYDDPTSDELSLCTKDSCDPYDKDGDGKSGCVHELDQGCWSCVMGIPVDGVEPCDDGNACTIDHCQTQEGLCVHTPINCDDGNTCTTDACEPDKGCVYHLNNKPCNDYNNCTLVDQCINGLCIGSVLSKCEDGNPCTEDFCDPWANCKHVPDIGDCDDGDPCTADYCHPTEGCTNVGFDGPCNDGDPCTENTICSGGLCSGDPVIACIPDTDKDAVHDPDDNCPYNWNTDQLDTDADGAGDACDLDADGDGVMNDEDNCPLVANPGQENTGGGTVGDACTPDTDGDGVIDDADNCPLIYNAGQTDLDADGIGDACDLDWDGDQVPNTWDNCPYLDNTNQANFDGDSQGDVCDPDDDNDGTIDSLDCEPFESAVAPTFPETCNGWDDNCDGLIDVENSAGCNFQAPDVDQDGYGTADTQEWACTCWKNSAWSDYLSDCDDNQPFVNPGAADACGDGVDNDCNGKVDDGCP